MQSRIVRDNDTVVSMPERLYLPNSGLDGLSVISVLYRHHVFFASAYIIRFSTALQMADAEEKIDVWPQDYNHQRPHSSFQYLSATGVRRPEYSRTPAREFFPHAPKCVRPLR